ncbi:MAG: DNA primase family protein [Solirubrobacteraceae bacterium]
MRTDYGNAERLVSAHGADLRYARGLGWLAWDGRRWRRDVDGDVERRAKATVRAMYAEAGDLEDEADRKATATWARKSEGAARIVAMIALARTEAAVVINPAVLDAAPFLLNVKNGTLDLQSGELREHHREDLLTKLAPVAWVPGARDRAWERFLAHTTGGDGDLATFLQRAAGYTLTGDTGEEVLFFAHGPTATGKSTLLEALGATLGEYAVTADFDTFLARRGDPGVRTDIARLAGARLVASLEVEDGKHLAEGLLKQLTGGDTVTARFLYSNAFEFAPAFKLWLAANGRPRVSADDAAIWRRIVQVPFVETVPAAERDPGLKRHLKDDPGARSAILAWALEGALAWQQHGLGVPERVRDYTADYRRENDPLAEWLEERCCEDPQAETPAAELRRSYEAWAEENGERPVSARGLGLQLAAHGFEKRSTGSRRTWRGVGLRELTL